MNELGIIILPEFPKPVKKDMSDNQNPKPYDAVLGNQNQAPEDAAVLGGIEGVKLRLSNENPEVRIKALYQALNYDEPGLDLVIKALEDKSPQVQIKAHSLLVPLSEQKVKQALVEFNPYNLKLEPIEVVTVNTSGKVTQRASHLAKYFVEDLGDGIDLEMAYIPGGSFIMGAPETEIHSTSRERPQHQVSISSFLMSKFSVTQAQWRIVAKLDKVNYNLEVEPIWFKNDNRCPVSRVTWYDAAEFCARLSKYTGKQYRLPSEAEWEYACRAGTTTAFYFGTTINRNLVNHNAINSYADVRMGKYKYETTPVGQFPPNAFGLYDMHGNVWEWCEDDWHYDYQGVPIDGSPWLDINYNNSQKKAMMRGGSCIYAPKFCRSAYREPTNNRAICYDHPLYIGFRVACRL